MRQSYAAANLAGHRPAALVNPLSHYFCADDIELKVDAVNKVQLLAQVADLAERRYGIERAAVERALWRREQAGSTGIGHGVALPHARIGGLSRPIVLLLTASHSIKFGSPDHQPVNKILAILVPTYATYEHLRILGVVTSMFADAGFRSKLDSVVSPHEAFALFRDWVLA